MLNAEAKTALGLLMLLSMRGIGPTTADRVARHFNHLDEAHDARSLSRIGLTRVAADALLDRALVAEAYDRARTILEKAERLSVKVISVYDDAYPSTLKRISDRPPVLYVKGKLPSHNRFVACIGTREPSEFGIAVTKRIAGYLAERGWSIVSGLAIGIDSIAHESAVENRGSTVAVMAGGLDSIYPKSNTRLAEQIVEMGGALIGEQAFGIPPTPRNLVQRDRLQSGLSIGTFVMQTGIIGGSMHTVRFTLQQGRLLFAPIPFGRHVDEPKSQGILALTKLTGPELAEAIGAKDDYRRLLIARFASRPVARGIAHRDDYDDVLASLEAARTKECNGPDQSSDKHPQLL